MGRKATTKLGMERARELGKRINFAREVLGLSKSELADAVGVSRPAISSWLAGRHTPNPEHLARICEVTGHPASFFSPSGAEPDDRAAFRRELVAIVGAKTAVELLKLSDDELRASFLRVLTEAPSDTVGAALREILSTSELEELIRTLWLANDLETVPVLLETVRVMTEGTAKAAGMKPGALRGKARRLVSAGR